MRHHIASLVARWDPESLDRRQMVAGLGSLVAAGGLSRGRHPGNGSEPTFRATGLNHLALRVTDVARSRDFYVQHLGLRVTRDGRQSCFLECGEHFLALFRGGAAAMDHYCFSIDDFEVDAVEARLKEAGLEPRVVRPDGRVYFEDPDGLTVQLAQSPR